MNRQRLKDDWVERNVFINRMKVGVGLTVLCFLLLAGRYAYLQLIHYEDFSARSENNRIKMRPVVPTRGLIYDRHGAVLAENAPAYRLEIVPEQVDDIPATLTRLAEIVPISEYDLQRFQRDRQQKNAFDAITLRYRLTADEVARLAVDQHVFNGVAVTPYLMRHYPYGDLFTHVVGYVRRMDKEELARLDPSVYRGTTHIGKTGVERSYEATLHGHSGLEQVETNVQGRVLRVLQREAPLPGEDLHLTLDTRVQHAARVGLGERPGAVIAIDPRDGGVIAAISTPSYDPNLFVNGISSAAYQTILDNPYRPLLNRVVSGVYVPGSTLKPFVALAGLEQEVINLETTVFSNGTFFLPGQTRPFRDWRRGGHGLVDVIGALEQSVNVYFYQLGMGLGIDRMHDYLAQFGFGRAVGIDIPGEVKGTLPSKAWKRGHYAEPWYPGETVIAAIGQGFNQTTPLQLAHALATLVADGWVKPPQVVRRAESDTEFKRIPIKRSEHWAAVRQGMVAVAHGEKGTARKIAEDAPYSMGGKTGTAQVFGLEEGEVYREENVAEHLRHHALFIAYAPAENPTIVVAVVVEHGGAGSSSAAPIARRVIDAWLVKANS